MTWFSGLFKKEEESKLLYLTEEGVVDKEPWFHSIHHGKYLQGDTRKFFLSFKDELEFYDHRDQLLESSVGFKHYLLNEKSQDFIYYAEIMYLFSLGKSLDEVALVYKSSFKNYLANKEKQELLELGKSDFVAHIKLLKQKDPELARQKILEIVAEVL